MAAPARTTYASRFSGNSLASTEYRIEGIAVSSLDDLADTLDPYGRPASLSGGQEGIRHQPSDITVKDDQPADLEQATAGLKADGQEGIRHQPSDITVKDSQPADLEKATAGLRAGSPIHDKEKDSQQFYVRSRIVCRVHGAPERSN